MSAGTPMNAGNARLSPSYAPLVSDASGICKQAFILGLFSKPRYPHLL